VRACEDVEWRALDRRDVQLDALGLGGLERQAGQRRRGREEVEVGQHEQAAVAVVGLRLRARAGRRPRGSTPRARHACARRTARRRVDGRKLQAPPAPHGGTMSCTRAPALRRQALTAMAGERADGMDRVGAHSGALTQRIAALVAQARVRPGAGRGAEHWRTGTPLCRTPGSVALVKTRCSPGCARCQRAGTLSPSSSTCAPAPG